ncbi:hypothetical protein PNEG_02583 [Pneumocystis murina B123]|uniref:Rab proteins geranylgeranyltransferase component A n=1 Tax=Pneumocystis murina (strain B123) TaxID=1069680 RepID=M7PFL7_PNEMU|nr:hypothetical protein PNEG_02583 [Pneumocystis murina B123]EMR09249.1 hypothetical protein PNEG_02583 [Pneumocystis murina B123]
MENNEQYDYIVYGTGLTESILVCACSVKNTVLNVDINPYYGKDYGSLRWDELKKWAKELKSNTVYYDSELIINNEEAMEKPKMYYFSLTPSLIYCKSKIIDLIISFNLQLYLHFKSFESSLIYDELYENGFSEILYTKEMLAFNKNVDFIWKRRVMRFIEFIYDITSEKSQEILKGHDDDLFVDFISSEPFSLPTLYTNMFVYGIALSYLPNITVKEALPKIRQFFLSLGVFIKFAILNCSFGGGSELIQALSRNAALKGATFVLKKRITSYNIDDKEEYPVTVTFDDNQKIKCKKLITSYQIGNYQPNTIILDEIPLLRSICLVKGDLSRILKKNTSIICSFPPHSLKSNEYPVQVIIDGSATGNCPNGQYIIYASTLTATKEKISILSAIQAILRVASINTSTSPEIIFTLTYFQHPIRTEPLYSQHLIPVQGISFNIDFNQDINHASDIYRFLFNQDLSFS